MVAVLDIVEWQPPCYSEKDRPQEQQRQQESGVDYFDLLPDAVVLVVLNRVCDIKALGRCRVVSRRFHALASHVENVLVKVDCVISGDDAAAIMGNKAKGLLGHLVRLVFRPLQLLHHFLAGPKKNAVSCGANGGAGGGGTGAAEVSHHSPSEVLRGFAGIRNLMIELPSGELGIEEGVLLKWKAEFGSTLESCVILGVAALEEGDQKAAATAAASEAAAADGKKASVPEESECIPDSFYTDGGLKKRVVWTISSLIAASARHYLLQQIICEHPTLESLVLTDADGQGMLCMSKRQLKEFREKPVAASASSSRTQVPDLNMKLWYAPSMSLPGGCSMKGATLVAIRPSNQQGAPSKDDDDEFISRAFSEPFRGVACALARRRTYLLEMNSF